MYMYLYTHTHTYEDANQTLRDEDYNVWDEKTHSLRWDGFGWH